MARVIASPLALVLARVQAPYQGCKCLPYTEQGQNGLFFQGLAAKNRFCQTVSSRVARPFPRRLGFQMRAGWEPPGRRLRTMYAPFGPVCCVLMRKVKSGIPVGAIEGRVFPLLQITMHHDTDIHNLLISLAWLGELRTDHVRRLWLPDHRLQAAQRLLQSLRADGYVERRMWSRWVPGRTTPQRQGALWSVSRKGRDMIRESDQYPPEYKEPRARRMVPHDSTTSEAIVRIIELGRAVEYEGQRGMSGLYVEREVRLDPVRPRPVMDALIIVTVGGDFDRPDLVPWSRDPTLEGERRVRYALENDRDTEPPTVIAAKASHYQRAGTPAWERRYGRFPLPLWLTPSTRRLQQILNLWRQAWPVGKWLLTTDAWLAQDYWIEYDRGAISERRLFSRSGMCRPEGDTHDQAALDSILRRKV